MDSSDEDVSSAPDSEASVKNSVLYLIARCIIALLLPVIFLFILSFIVGLLVVLFGSFSVQSPISLSSQCKILSSSVDIRSSKVCELGLLNYNAKNVFNPSEKRKFRCHYDYYWASIFKVEYKDLLSGQIRLALAEAPNEALPVDCRPSFNTAWLTKDKFKVNQTYNCWYTSDISKVSIYDDSFFSCQARNPSMVEMLRRSYILFMEMLHSMLIRRTGAAGTIYWRWETIAGIIMGFSTPLISLTFLSLVQHLKSLPRICTARLLPQAVNGDFLKRACFFVVYFSFTGLLFTQYGKRLGLSFSHVYRRD
ncbi:hypothetical protein SAY86_022791 [Trapa natans]|uniref:Uncharacterized protein n=1 Tax=Trapa natans TaxID=22666 RepID=A0AAN7LTI1_TRANT|nr:hypothetical protein SAY86_022791 [Trapa natans]